METAETKTIRNCGKRERARAGRLERGGLAGVSGDRSVARGGGTECDDRPETGVGIDGDRGGARSRSYGSSAEAGSHEAEKKSGRV